MAIILFIIYYLAARWACNETIWKDKIFIGGAMEIALHKFILPIIIGWILLPIAILKKGFSG